MLVIFQLPTDVIPKKDSIQLLELYGTFDMVSGDSAKPKRPENLNKFYSTLLWKTQNQQNQNLNHGNLVASKGSSAQPSLLVGMSV
ncbi:hypothetical protein CRD_03000 [Raphidiopsis brookii D9]|nr:hypothetical protein CRD_03000 [Raphidiopsis brookii D9]